MDTNLKFLRQSLGLTQEEFAQSVGVAKSTYSNYELGIREPRSDFWVAVAKKYNVSVDYLMGYVSDPLARAGERMMEFVLSPSSFERDILQKYRLLDDHGKKIVDFVLTAEADRCKAEALPVESEPAEDDSNVVGLSGLFPHLGLASAGTGALAQDEPVDWERRAEAPKHATATVTIKSESMEPLFHDGDLIFVDTTRPAEEGEIGVFAVDGQTYCKRLRYVDGVAHLESLNPNYGPIIVNHDDARQIGRVVQK